MAELRGGMQPTSLMIFGSWREHAAWTSAARLRPLATQPLQEPLQQPLLPPRRSQPHPQQNYVAESAPSHSHPRLSLGSEPTSAAVLAPVIAGHDFVSSELPPNKQKWNRSTLDPGVPGPGLGAPGSGPGAPGPRPGASGHGLGASEPGPGAVGPGPSGPGSCPGVSGLGASIGRVGLGCLSGCCRDVVWACFVVWGRCGVAGGCLGSICGLDFVGVELSSCLCSICCLGSVGVGAAGCCLGSICTYGAGVHRVAVWI